MKRWLMVALFAVACDDGGGDEPVVDTGVVDGGGGAGGQMADMMPPDMGRAAGELTASPDRFRVPAVAPGDIAESNVELSNEGEETVFIDKIAFSGTDGIQILWRYKQQNRAFVGIDLDGDDKFAYPLEVEAGQTIVLIVEYRPRVEANPQGNVVYVVGDTENVLPIESMAAEGVVTVEPAEGAFGRVMPGASTDITFNIRNRGSGVLDFTGFELDSEVYSVGFEDGRELTADNLGQPDDDGQAGLSPDQDFDLVVTYTPSADGGDEAVLTLFSNDPVNPETMIPLVGNRDEPCIEADPATLVWGGSLGVDSQATVNIRRCSPATLNIASVRLRPGTPQELTLLPEPPVTPAVIDSDEPYPILVHFVPNEARDFVGTLEVESDDPVREILRIPLTATGE